MVDETQNGSLQQSGSSNTAVTGNPQQISPSGLQPQSSTSLQPTSAQTINSINQLDQGATAISLSKIANTSTTSVQPATTPAQTSSKHVLLYGAAGIIVAAIMAGMIYSLLRQR